MVEVLGEGEEAHHDLKHRSRTARESLSETKEREERVEGAKESESEEHRTRSTMKVESTQKRKRKRSEETKAKAMRAEKRTRSDPGLVPPKANAERLESGISKARQLLEAHLRDMQTQRIELEAQLKSLTDSAASLYADLINSTKEDRKALATLKAEGDPNQFRQILLRLKEAEESYLRGVKEATDAKEVEDMLAGVKEEIAIAQVMLQSGAAMKASAGQIDSSLIEDELDVSDAMSD
jgi:hypothetical protein